MSTSDIDKTMSTIDKVVANQETAAFEEALILRGYVVILYSIVLA